MPFHPWCFEIFIRQSRHRFGQIDADGLMDWRDYHNEQYEICENERRENDRQGKKDYERPRNLSAFDSIHRDPAAERGGYGQDWVHNEGCEYLAANAVHVPDLNPLLHAAVDDSNAADGLAGVFLLEQDVQWHRQDIKDPFSVLSAELRLEILEYLDSISIAALRLSSRAFRQLPQSLFYTLLRKELPSLWEIADDDEGEPSPYFWTAYSARDFAPSYRGHDCDDIYCSHYCEDDDQAREQYNKEILHYRTVIHDEMPELFEDWRAAEPSYADIQDAPEWPPVIPEPLRLKKGQTNWYRLYVSLMRKQREGGLKGLKNRERIWKDVACIIERIATCREEGDIP